MKRSARIKVMLWFLAALLCALPIGLARAIVPIPEAIERPAPAEFEPSLERFLKDFGIEQSAPVLRNTKAAKIGGMHTDAWVLRFEDPSMCFKDLCLTIIGSFQNQNFQPHVMFVAGRFLTRGDVFGENFGIRTPPAVGFLTSQDGSDDRGSIGAIETPKGWVLGAVPNK